MADATLAVLHVGLQPVTGPWSVMRSLARAQREKYAAVGLGVVSYADWPAEYAENLAAFAPYAFRATTPHWFGTASFLWQRVAPPPLSQWIAAVKRQSGARRCVVHFHNAWLSGVFLPLAREEAGTRVVATFHGVAGAEQLARQPVRRAAHRWMAQRLRRHRAALTSVDAANLEPAARLFGLPPESFDIVPNGLPRRAVAPRHVPVERGTLTVAHVGTLNADKGWRLVADAVEHLRREGHSIRLRIAGDGPDAEAVRARARASGGTIEYLGYVREPVESVLPGVDLLVLMTANDGLPMAVIEALSSGVPVVTTAVGGLPGAVRDGVSGRLVAREVKALADALRDVCESPGRITQWSAGALAVFDERYALDRVVDAYDAIYRRAA